MTYISGLKDLISIKQKYPGLEMILHTDQGSVYASKDFNELLPLYNIVHSMSRAGTPTDNAAMEAINGWIKTEHLLKVTREDGSIVCPYITHRRGRNFICCHLTNLA